MPDEFIDGMVNAPLCSVMIFARLERSLGRSVDQERDSYGPNENTVHILVTLNAQMDPLTGAAVPALAEKTSEIKKLAQKNGGITLVADTICRTRATDRYQDLAPFCTGEWQIHTDAEGAFRLHRWD